MRIEATPLSGWGPIPADRGMGPDQCRRGASVQPPSPPGSAVGL